MYMSDVTPSKVSLSVRKYIPPPPSPNLIHPSSQVVVCPVAVGAVLLHETSDLQDLEFMAHSAI